ncbi:4610_t:CDS:2 [Dentiscutata erythropus]|uniref:4610_t:CDS:1 n=1 Tax=Dentiscutata erythropus TaxID=1348616 RepID=A0A9N9DU21_9GLOM|nr:4610_t:CDS:2 [Dentiscutata erythropus]
MPCKDCCEKRGSSGWENNCHIFTDEDSTMIDNPIGKIGRSLLQMNVDCIQWYFGNNPVGNPQIPVNLCFLFYNNELTPDICTMPPQPIADKTEVLFDSGIIRCENEGCFNH